MVTNRCRTSAWRATADPRRIRMFTSIPTFVAAEKMKRRLITLGIGGALFITAAWWLGGRSGYDYGLTCTKCLQYQHIVEKKLLGVTYSSTKRLLEDPSYYSEITGHECEHVFHRDGFGRSKYFLGRSIIGCGVTSEGIFFRERNQVVQRVFQLDSELDSPMLSTRTLALVDQLVPPDTNWKAKMSSMDEPAMKLFLLSAKLSKTETEEAWREALAIAETGSVADLENQYTQQVGGAKRE